MSIDHLRLVLPIVITSTFVTLSGCGDQAAFNSFSGTKKASDDAIAERPGDSDKTEEPGTTDDPLGTPVDAATDANGTGVLTDADIQALKEQCGNEKTIQFTQEVIFPKPAGNCKWGQEGNMTFDVANQLIITARNEQHEALNLPKAAKFCDLDLKFPLQQMRYDDEILLLFDGVVLAASQDYSGVNGFASENGFLMYDWEKIKGDPYPIDDRTQFFIDKDCADCKIPQTETNGSIDIRIKPETIQKLSLFSGLGVDSKETHSKHTLSFVTTGDNDAQQDCMHEEFKFAVTGHYVE